ncbi:hypothetical protein KM427_04095 [Nocardioides sp. LMS-CY]|uniref:hypothetical protein n=1 Tax=Nocardioides sp. (strain LMS-CY) TaxID=2840457 RepID=UPI001BFFF5C6|nr:hypothetical protein [Nocardioides sp. LMS-CY]QWF22928.1 hypothetical protein KM427_04095 [Nocardioides sp. LMS-CY]
MRRQVDGGGTLMRARLRAAALPVLMMLVAGVSIAAPARADHRLDQHWDRNTPTATAVAQVYFVDHTGPNWPVASMIAGPWDNRPAYYRPYYLLPGNCTPSALHCVPVTTINNPGVGRGVTTYNVNWATLHIVHGSMTVELNNAYSYTTALRREVTCHELGHATGVLWEGSQDGSCMKGGAPYVDTATPHDYNVIEAVYNH